VRPGRTWLARAGPEDTPALAALEASCFSHPWPRAHFEEEIAAGGQGAVLVLRAPGDVIVAYVVYRVVEDELWVMDVAVAEEARRRGLATWLLRFAMAKAARAGARRGLLEVRRSNDAAIRMYERLGFRRIAERRDYYREPVEDALVLGREALAAHP
jgi:ribosomal-protein-alanine N-acetyltransferase